MLESFFWAPPGTGDRATREGYKTPLAAGILREPAGESAKEFRGDFRTPLEGTPSKITIISVMPKVHLKLKAPEKVQTFSK